MFLVITGAISSGKSTLLEKLVNALSKQYRIGGLITKGQERRFFLDIKSRKKEYFSSEEDEDGERIGKYFLSRRSLDFAFSVIKESKNNDIIIVDEIGRLEKEKKGLYGAIESLLNDVKTDVKIIILVIRKDLLQELLKLFNIRPAEIWEVKHSTKDSVLSNLIECIKNEIIKIEGGRAVS